MNAEPSDDDVVAAVLAGNTTQFATLIRRYQHQVRRIASSLLDPDIIENLVQQTFINAFEHLRQWRKADSFAAWLRAIAANLVRLEVRRSLRENSHMRRYHDYLLVALDEEAAFDEQTRRLAEAITACREHLATPAAQAIALRYDQALGIEEIAAALGRTALATRQLLFRARIALKTCAQQRLVSP